MPDEDIMQIARSQYEAWNDRDFDRLGSLFADDAEIVVAGSDARFRGPEGARDYGRTWVDAFPDGRISIDTETAQGDRVVIEYTGHGTQTGTLRGPAGEIPPTGRSVTLQLCDVTEVRGGKIAAVRTYFDSAALLTQLGVMEAAGAQAQA